VIPCPPSSVLAALRAALRRRSPPKRPSSLRCGRPRAGRAWCDVTAAKLRLGVGAAAADFDPRACALPTNRGVARVWIRPDVGKELFAGRTKERETPPSCTPAAPLNAFLSYACTDFLAVGETEILAEAVAEVRTAGAIHAALSERAAAILELGLLVLADAIASPAVHRIGLGVRLARRTARSPGRTPCSPGAAGSSRSTASAHRASRHAPISGHGLTTRASRTAVATASARHSCGARSSSRSIASRTRRGATSCLASAARARAVRPAALFDANVRPAHEPVVARTFVARAALGCRAARRLVVGGAVLATGACGHPEGSRKPGDGVAKENSLHSRKRFHAAATHARARVSRGAAAVFPAAAEVFS
jgi:hypothetical protein